jgi:cytochrome c553
MKTRIWMLLAAALAALADAGAQPPSVRAGSGDEMKAVYATPADIADGRRAAETACKGCHGLNGVSEAKDVPHLAGQRAAYLLQELRIYKQGGRGANPMANAVKLLSDDTLMKTAAYYASLDPPQPASSAAKSPARPDPVAAGKAAAAACAGCHGEDGVSKIAGTPSLVGLDPKYLVAAIAAYKSGQRKNDLMKSLVAGLSDADAKNVALYYALQKPVRAPTPSTGDAAAGKSAAAACAGCHGEQGVSANADTPSLAGQDTQYVSAALRAYKDGSRANDVMKGSAAALDDAAMKNVAAHYAALTPQAPKVARPMTPAQLAERCDRCHGVNGNSTDPRTPALAAQRADYLEKALAAYRNGARKSTTMAAMSDMLQAADFEAVAAYYARQKARPVVYVTVPAK